MFVYFAILLVVGQFLDVHSSPPEQKDRLVCDQSISSGKIVKFTIEGCQQDTVCELPISDSRKIEIDFIPGKESNLTVDIQTLFAVTKDNPLLVSFALVGFKKNGCGEERNIVCPLKAGTEYKYKNDIDIKPIFPPMKFPLKITLTGENKEQIACINTEIKIVAKAAG